jgi:hypothetical protein
METKNADEIINMIAETLGESDDLFILKIAKLVLSENIKYVGGKFGGGFEIIP